MDNSLSKAEVVYEASLVSSTLPNAINLEITNLCNLRCGFCINHHPDFRKKGFMSHELLKRIIDELSGNIAISICGIGEPTIHPSFKDFVNLLTKKFCNVSLVTNGHNLSNETIDFLINSSLTKINISLDYFECNGYKRLKNGELDNVLSNINLLLKIRDRNSKKQPAIQINMLAQKGLEQQIQDALVYFTPKLGENDCVYSRCIKDLAGQVEVALMEGAEDWFFLEKFKNHLSKNNIDTSKFVVENWCKLLGIEEKLPYLMTCRHPFRYCMVLWDGRVVVCCNDFNAHLEMGNLNNNSMNDIWNGESYRVFRAAMKAKAFEKYPICNKCNEWYKCV